MYGMLSYAEYDTPEDVPSTSVRTLIQAERGFAAAAVFVFFGGRLGFQQKTSLTLRGAMDLREEINPTQAEQY